VAKESTYYLVAKLVAQKESLLGNYDQLFLSALPTGTSVPMSDAEMNWTLAGSVGFNFNDNIDRILVSGGSGTTWVFDELRIGTDFRAVVSNQIELVPGDFDGDGEVDGADLVLWQGGYGMDSGANISNGDSDGDGDVDGRDFLAWQRNFGYGTNSVETVSAIPEPTTNLLAIGVSTLLIIRKRLRRRE
jgi:hypothetical protein